MQPIHRKGSDGCGRRLRGSRGLGGSAPCSTAFCSALAKAEKDYGVRVGDSVRTAKALLSQLDDVARKARLEHMGLFPPDFIAHPHTRKLLENRRKMVDGELGVDWGTAELLAFATLVRLF